jgi:hypothetical protein
MGRTRVVGTRTPVIWLLIVVAAVIAVAVLAFALVFLPRSREKQAEEARLAEVEQHYQAGVAFEKLGDWAAAEGEYKQAIGLDAGYKDIQVRLAEVKARAAEAVAGAAATAAAQAAQAQATAEAAPAATAAALEVHYQRALGFINLQQWPEA